MLGIQVKSIATPRSRGPCTFGVGVMMLPMLGRGCLRSAACSCPGRQVLRPSGLRPVLFPVWAARSYKWPFLLLFVPYQILFPYRVVIKQRPLHSHFMSGEVEVAALARMQLGDEQGSSVRPLVAVLTPLCAMPVPGDFLAASCLLSFPWLSGCRRREPN